MIKRVLTAALLAVLVVGVALAAPSIGQAGPTFKLPGADGREYDLAAYKGKAKAIVLVWISKNCPISIAYDNYYNTFYNQFREKGVIILAINSNKNETMDEIKQHAQAKGFRFAVLRDGNARVADLYGAGRTPEVRVLNSNLVLKYKGALSNNQNPARATVWHAANAVNAVLAGRNPNPAEVDAFGCTIKR